MKNFLLLLFISPLFAFSQDDSVLTLTSSAQSNSKVAAGWIKLDAGWQYKAGDNKEWAKPDFNDSSWSSINLFQDLYPLPQIPKQGIIWFRVKIKNDSTFEQPLLMRIYQSGASEIYLDGQLIHRFGSVTTNSGKSKFYNPDRDNFSFPLSNGKEQLLAIRFANMPVRYTSYNNYRSFLLLWVSTADNAQNDYITRFYKTFINRFYVGVGVALILFILYLSLYLFFPANKVNLYFSLCNFFFSLFLISTLQLYNNHDEVTIINFLTTIFGTLYLLSLLYCIYKTFHRPLRWMYWLLLLLGGISVLSTFFNNGDYLSMSLALLTLIDALRITIQSVRTTSNKGPVILVVCYAINLVFWTCSFLSELSVISMPWLGGYVPFAYLMGPVGLAIYLGYSHAFTSGLLRQKLAEVEQLSKEKQQILSDQNVVLDRQVKERTAELNRSLHDLKSTQAQLVQSEKMASLGELTAGIAHEIQNPLNFVNNFSEVNAELLNELKDGALRKLPEDVRKEADEIVENLRQNVDKVSFHGKRADGIVKGMLQHSRQTSGTKEPTDINALADEYLRLSYHGLRMKDKSFNATLKTDFESSIGNIQVIPQDIGKVLLNLYNNAFYVLSEKKRHIGGGYEPSLSVSTKKIGHIVEIRVKDNGNGIPEKVVDKIFQPFFTTKPTGQGTGLGLSLAYDIVKAHGGELKVATEEGTGSEFIIELPSGV